MAQLVELLYRGLIEKEKDVQKIVVDVVINIQQETDMNKLKILDLQHNGLCLIGEQKKSGVLLPGTKGVENITQAIKLIKDKYQLAGNATIYIFQTERFLVA
ncbi:MAG: hypothetical protein GXP45_04510 [bacterium]|nr:hypothetical protein [bacterium]